MNPSPSQRLLPLLFTALFFTACTTSGTSTPSPSRPPSTPVQETTAAPSPTLTPTKTAPIQVDPAKLRGLSLQLWDAFAGPSASAFLTQVGQFNSDNEWGIVVYPSNLGDYSSLYTAVSGSLASGPKPDLVVTLPEQLAGWDASGSIVDLNPYLGDPTWGLSSTESADIPAPFWSQDLVNGRRLGLPAQRSVRVLFYNKTWAHELGFQSPPETADEFRQQACQANASFRKDSIPQNDGFGGWVVDTDWQTTYSWMLAFGGGVQEDGSYRFRTDENLAALQFLKKLYDDHCAWISLAPTSYDSFARRSALFLSGDLAEVPLVAEAMSRLKNADDWTVLPFPGPQANVLVTYGPSFGILSSTPEKQLAAWLFIRWSLSAENQSSWAEATGSLPLRTSALGALGDYAARVPQWQAAVASIALLRGTPELASWRQVRYVLEDGTLSIFRVNTPVDQIPSVLAEIDAMAEELGK